METIGEGDGGVMEDGMRVSEESEMGKCECDGGAECEMCDGRMREGVMEVCFVRTVRCY